MKILIITPEYSGFGGGIMTFYQHLARALVDAGCSVSVAEGSMWRMADSDTVQYEDGIAVHVLESDRFTRVHAGLGHLASMPILRRHVASSLALWEQVRGQVDFDVIEAADFGLCALGPVLDQSTVVQQLHASIGQIGLYDHQPDQALDEIMGLAIDTELVRLACPQTYSLSNARFWSGQTGKPVEVLRPAWFAPDRSEGDLETGAGHVSVFGRIQRWKGPHILCEAMRLLGDSRPQVDWYGRDTPSGEGGVSTGAWLARTFPDIWQRSVMPRSPVPADQVRAIQKVSLVNVVPSTWDVFNFTAIEAMASGRPTVCSDGAGASELIEDGVNGFVYRSDDATSLANALQRALSLPKSRAKAMGEAAADTIESELDPARIVEARLSAYRAAKLTSTGNTVPEWLTSLARTQRPRQRDPLAFLAHVPLRDLVSYTGRRILDRVRGTKR